MRTAESDRAGHWQDYESQPLMAVVFCVSSAKMMVFRL